MNQTPVAAPPAAAAPQGPTTCPNCGSHVLFSVVLDYTVAGGYRPDHNGVTPEHGDTISRCEDCGHFYVHLVPGTEPAPAATPDEPAESDTAELQAKIADLEQQLAAATAVPPAPPSTSTSPPDTQQAAPAADTPPAADAEAGETSTVPDPPANQEVSDGTPEGA